MSVRWPVWVALLAVLIPSAWFVWTARDMPQIAHFHDDGIYWVTAKSLATGNGYKIPSLPGEPAATKYPPVYPLYLAIAWKLAPSFPANLGWAALLAWLPLPFVLSGAIRLWSRAGLTPVQQMAGCALAALSPAVVFQSSLVMSDVFFTALLLATLILLESRWAAYAGLLAGVVYLTRSAGIVLLLSVPLVMLMRRQRRPALLFVLGMLPAVIGWTLWVRLHATPASDAIALYYTDYLGYYRSTVHWADMPALLAKNFDELFAAIGDLFVLGLDGGFFGHHLARLLALFSIAGVVRLARRGLLLHFVAFAPLYAAMLVVWNYAPTERLLLPLFPLLLAGFLIELWHLAAMLTGAIRGSKLPDRIVALAATAVVACFFFYMARENYRAIATGLPAFISQCRSNRDRLMPVYAWVASNTPTDSVFVAFSDPVFFLYTGRQACRIPSNPTDSYRGDFPAALQRLRNLDRFKTAYRLTHLLITDTDYETDLPQTERLQALAILRGQRGLQVIEPGHPPARRDILELPPRPL